MKGLGCRVDSRNWLSCGGDYCAGVRLHTVIVCASVRFWTPSFKKVRLGARGAAGGGPGPVLGQKGPFSAKSRAKTRQKGAIGEKSAPD